MVNDASPTPAALLRRFVVAGWGVSWGVLIATAITCALIQFRDASSEHPHPDLLASDYLSRYDGVFWQEHYEHTWYALACVLGAAWWLDRNSVLAPRGMAGAAGGHRLRAGRGVGLSRHLQGGREPRSLPGHGSDPGAPTLPANGPSRPECRPGPFGLFGPVGPVGRGGHCRTASRNVVCGRHRLRSPGVLDPRRGGAASRRNGGE